MYHGQECITKIRKMLRIAIACSHTIATWICNGDSVSTVDVCMPLPFAIDVVACVAVAGMQLDSQFHRRTCQRIERKKQIYTYILSIRLCCEFGVLCASMCASLLLCVQCACVGVSFARLHLEFIIYVSWHDVRRALLYLFSFPLACLFRFFLSELYIWFVIRIYRFICVWAKRTKSEQKCRLLITMHFAHQWISERHKQDKQAEDTHSAVIWFCWFCDFVFDLLQSLGSTAHNMSFSSQSVRSDSDDDYDIHQVCSNYIIATFLISSAVHTTL